jgi:acetolactate synthase-1/2/3 large subunit
MPPEMPESLNVRGGSQSSRSNKTVAHEIVASLKRHGVEALIGQSIPTAVHLAGLDEGLRQITTRTEKSAAMLADGYARISRKVPVVTSLGGPGTPLMMAGMGEAYHASIPMVALFQDVPRSHRDRNYAQEFADEAALRTVTKLVRRVDRADRVEDYIDMSFAAAASGRPGPAALLLPPDLLDEASDHVGRREARLGAYPIDRTVADPQQVEVAAKLLLEAASPLIVAGGGLITADAVEELAWFQDEAAIPVGTTQMGKGAVAEMHPLSLGVLGYTMGRRSPAYYCREIVRRADVVLLVGTRTNQNGTNAWTLFPSGARFIHLDIDSAEIGRTYEALRLVGDAKLTLRALRRAMEVGDLQRRREARSTLSAEIAAGRSRRAAEVARLLASDAVPIRPERIMSEIAKVLTPASIVCADASYATVWAATYLEARKAGMRFISPRGLAGIGWGFPIALGAKLARPEAPLVSIAGDGGFAHAWAEMETAARHRLNVVQVVLNNQVLGYQRHAELASYGRHTEAVAFAPVDHAAIARACGWIAFRIERPDDIAGALSEALAAERPALLDVITDPEAWPPIQNFEGRIEDHP